MHNERNEIINNLALKVESLKNELGDVRSYKNKKYDYFKLKNIIKENLQDEQDKKSFLYSDKRQNDIYDDFVKEKININDYLNAIEDIHKANYSPDQANYNTCDIDEINRLEINAINKAKELGIRIS